jgi:hypothetical protein
MDPAGGEITDGFYFVEGTHPCPVHQINNLFAVQFRKTHFFLPPPTNRYYRWEEIFPSFSGHGSSWPAALPALVKYRNIFLRITTAWIFRPQKTKDWHRKKGRDIKYKAAIPRKRMREAFPEVKK